MFVLRMMDGMWLLCEEDDDEQMTKIAQLGKSVCSFS